MRLKTLLELIDKEHHWSTSDLKAAILDLLIERAEEAETAQQAANLFEVVQ